MFSQKYKHFFRDSCLDISLETLVWFWLDKLASVFPVDLLKSDAMDRAGTAYERWRDGHKNQYQKRLLGCRTDSFYVDKRDISSNQEGVVQKWRSCRCSSSWSMCVMVAWGLEASRRGQSEEEDRLEYQKSFSSLERANLLSSSDAQQVFPPPPHGRQ